MVLKNLKNLIFNIFCLFAQAGPDLLPLAGGPRRRALVRHRAAEWGRTAIRPRPPRAGPRLPWAAVLAPVRLEERRSRHGLEGEWGEWWCLLQLDGQGHVEHLFSIIQYNYFL